MVGSRFGKRGVPDIVGCYRGWFFAIEAKAPGKEATPLQEHELESIEKAGGFWLVADGIGQVTSFFADPDRWPKHL